MIRHVPNLLSAFRIASVPVLLGLAWQGSLVPFLVLFAAGLASDALDGAIARRFRVETDFGARLDQWGDFALWVSFPVGALWLWPDIVRREAAYVVLALVCLLLPTAIAYVKYREVPGYHTWTAKLDSVAMAIAVPALLLFDVAWPFRLAALFLVVCAIDELGITLQLRRCHHDVPSLFHARALRRREAHPDAPAS